MTSSFVASMPTRASITLKAGVERILKDRVPGVTEVRHVEVETAVSL